MKKIMAKIIKGKVHVGKKLWEVTGKTEHCYWLKRRDKIMLISKELVQLIKEE